MKISKCKGCGADIILTITEAGIRKPIDAKEYTLFTLEEQPDGTVQAKALQVHASHFSTCPKADEFRKPVRGGGA